jgi:hypothetical protein
MCLPYTNEHFVFTREFISLCFDNGHAVIRVDIKAAFDVLENIIVEESAEPVNLPLALLQHITDDFADKRQIGHGGFGVVYKVSLCSTIPGCKSFHKAEQNLV